MLHRPLESVWLGRPRAAMGCAPTLRCTREDVNRYPPVVKSWNGVITFHSDLFRRIRPFPCTSFCDHLLLTSGGVLVPAAWCVQDRRVFTDRYYVSLGTAIVTQRLRVPGGKVNDFSMYSQYLGFLYCGISIVLAVFEDSVLRILPYSQLFGVR